MKRQLMAAWCARAAVLAVFVTTLMAGYAATASANNIGVWWAGTKENVTKNYGGDSGFNVPNVKAGSGEIVLNRTAEQSLNEAGGSGIFQAGLYNSGSGTKIDTCSSTFGEEQDIFTEWREQGSGYSYNCNLYGAASTIGTCVFNLGLSSGGEWYAAGGCPSSPGLINLSLNWGEGYSYVGGELNNDENGLANGSSTNTIYDPEGQEYVVWKGSNRTSAEAPPWIWCGYPTKEWFQGTPDYDFGMVHPSTDDFCTE
jgi:hypothetical protein